MTTDDGSSELEMRSVYDHIRRRQCCHMIILGLLYSVLMAGAFCMMKDCFKHGRADTGAMRTTTANIKVKIDHNNMSGGTVGPSSSHDGSSGHLWCITLLFGFGFLGFLAIANAASSNQKTLASFFMDYHELKSRKVLTEKELESGVKKQALEVLIAEAKSKTKNEQEK